jgi:hypothetical protein
MVLPARRYPAMIFERMSLPCVLVAGVLALSGCYETRQPVIGRGVEVPDVPGTYRCQNERGGDSSTATISAPAQLGANDVVYLATLDNHRYAVRMAALSDGLLLLEGRGDFRGAQIAYVRRLDADRYELLVTGSQARDQLTALARAHGVKIEFPTQGPPRIDAPPDRERTFLLAHTPAVLQRTATCSRVR